MDKEKRRALRALVLITTPKLSKKAEALFAESKIPLQYQWNAVGTAPNEMIDILGLGSPDKHIQIVLLPRSSAPEILKKLKKKLRLGSVNSGIAFTLPLSGVSNLVLRMLESQENSQNESAERKDDNAMAEPKYALVTVVIDQGNSEEVMEVARQAGAGGGTVVHGRRVSDKETMGLWGMSIQEEREMLFIVTTQENKLPIMQAISEKCGMHSKAKGIVLSVPIDAVIGLDDN